MKIQDDAFVYRMTSLPVVNLTKTFSDSDAFIDADTGSAGCATQTCPRSAMRAGLVSRSWSGDLLTDNKG